jgi:hypothetical protein
MGFPVLFSSKNQSYTLSAKATIKEHMVYNAKKQAVSLSGYLTWNSFTQVLAIVLKDVLILSEKDKWLQLSLLGWRIIKRKALPP